jgi:hypothetical protein
MNRIFRIRTALLAAIVGVVAACDTPVSPSEHPEAGGVVILDASTGVVIAQVIGGNTVDFVTPLELDVDQTLDVQIKFLDADDPQNLALAFLPDADEGETLRVLVTNASVVEYEDHGDTGAFRALAVGETTVRFQLMHGSHPDYESGWLTVNVQ